MSNQKYITVKKLAEITDLENTTMRTFLSRSEFSKYIYRTKIDNRYKTVYLFNANFVEELCNFLTLKHQYKCIENLKDFWRIFKKLNAEAKDV